MATLSSFWEYLYKTHGINLEKWLWFSEGRRDWPSHYDLYDNIVTDNTTLKCWYYLVDPE